MGATREERGKGEGGRWERRVECRIEGRVSAWLLAPLCDSHGREEAKGQTALLYFFTLFLALALTLTLTLTLNVTLTHTLTRRRYVAALAVFCEMASARAA